MDMSKRSVAIVFAIFLPSCLLADFSYEQTSKITGGMIAGMMKFVGTFSKQVREPMIVTVAVRGDRMVNLSARHASIIDLDKETLTSVDFDKKQYSVMTFAEMKQMLDQMSENMKNSKDADKVNMDFNVSVKDTGATRQIAGFNTHEVIMSFEIQGTDAKSGQKGGLAVTADMWIAPKVSGFEEIADFHKRMAQKLNWTPSEGMTGMMQSRPELLKGMAQIYKESAKLNGMPVYQVIKMGGKMEGQPQGQNSLPPQQQPAPRTSGDSQQDRPTVSGAVGGALAGRLGLGGFGRRKKQQQDEPPQTTDQAAANENAQPPADASGVLMEMTTELSSFSAAPVDSAKFEVPAGFRRVEAESMQRRGHR